MLFESVGILTKIFSDNDDEVMALLHCDGTVMALLSVGSCSSLRKTILLVVENICIF